MVSANPITVLVHEYASGDRAALDRLLPLVYAELRRIAEKHLRGSSPAILCNLLRSSTSWRHNPMDAD